MKEILTWAVLSGITFILFLACLMFTVIRKNKKLLLPSILLFFCFLALIGMTGYTFISKAYPSVEKMIKPRSGLEIYEALFGTTMNHCIKVKNYQDQIIPRLDNGIWLEVQTCPAEIHRIMTLHPYTVESYSTSRWNDTYVPEGSLYWFDPTKFGEQVWMYTYSTGDGRNTQTIWLYRDSTQMLVKSLFD